jgi:hypothetical protein
MAQLYPALTDSILPGERRDYLSFRGFVDFTYILLYSFIAALVLYLSLTISLALFAPISKFISKGNGNPPRQA